MECRLMRAWSVILGLLPLSAPAQTTLPDVNVTAPKWEERHGGYLISSNFEVDSHMSAVIYPAEPFQRDDIVSVRLTQMQDDEYFVLQECAAADCTQAHSCASGMPTVRSDSRCSSPTACGFRTKASSSCGCSFPMSGGLGAFTGYEPLSPPLVLNPTGTAEQFHAIDLKAAQERGPVKAVSSTHDGSSCVLRFEGGTSVLIQRMHAVE